MKALVVDDELEIRNALSAGLKIARCKHVHTASTGEEALRLAMQNSYDLITLDIRMPSISGIDILPILRTLLPHAIITIISAYVADQVADVHREHADLVLQKPFKMDTLGALVPLARDIAEKRAAIRDLDEWGRALRARWPQDLPVEQVGIVRSTDRLKEIVRFYSEGIGLQTVGSTEDSAGYSTVILGLPGDDYHLTFTRRENGDSLPASTRDTRIVFYIPDRDAVDRIVARLGALGYSPVSDREEQEVWVEDPDGWPVVLMNTDGFQTGG